MKLTSPTIALIFLVACQSSQESQNSNQDKSLTNSKEGNFNNPIVKEILIWQKATVTYIPHSGGFYGLITEKGEKLLPINLPEAFRNDGTLVNVYGKKSPNIVTYHKWGTAFDVKQVNLIKEKE